MRLELADIPTTALSEEDEKQGFIEFLDRKSTTLLVCTIYIVLLCTTAACASYALLFLAAGR